MFRPLELRGNDPSLATFTTIVKTNTGGTFERDADFFKTVHSGGVGRAREEAEDKAREKQEWKDKVSECAHHWALVRCGSGVLGSSASCLI